MAADFADSAEALYREGRPRGSGHYPGRGRICVLLRNRRNLRLVFFLIPVQGSESLYQQTCDSSTPALRPPLGMTSGPNIQNELVAR